MIATQPALQPAPKSSPSEKLSEQVIDRISNETSSDDKTPPPSFVEGSAERKNKAKIEAFQKAMTDWVRLALVVPVLALIVIIANPEEAGIGDFKFKAMGVREITTVATALLIVKLLRDASRLLAVFRISDLSVDLTEAATMESYVNVAYVRPLDLFRAKNGDAESYRTLGLLSIERVRVFLLWTVAVLVGGSVLVALGIAISGMVSKPALVPSAFSYGLAALTIALLTVAALDFLAICIARWPRLALLTRMNNWKAAIADCERDASALKLPLPSLWPPLTNDRLARFQKEIELYRVAEECEREAPRGKDDGLWDSLPEPWPVNGPYRYSFLHRSLPGRSDTLAERRQDAFETYKKLYKEIEENICLRDKPIIYLDEDEYFLSDDNHNADKLEKRVEKERNEFNRVKAQYVSIQWCKQEAPQLKKPVHIPLYWDYDDLSAVADVTFEIMFARWIERDEFWSARSQTWIQFRPTHKKVWRKIIAAIRTLNLITRHPNPLLALRAYQEEMRRQEWRLCRSQFDQVDTSSSPTPPPPHSD